MSKHYIIDTQEGREPYNTYLVLPYTLLQKLMPILREEMMKGLVSDDKEDRIILHLNLSREKMNHVKMIAVRTINLEA
jgi:hypothetical protein